MIVTPSSKFRIAIPKAMREKLGIKAGQRLSLMERDGSMIITPVPDDPIAYLRGALKDRPSLTQRLLEERQRDLEHE